MLRSARDSGSLDGNCYNSSDWLPPCNMVLSYKLYIRKLIFFVCFLTSISSLSSVKKWKCKPMSKMVEDRFSLIRVLANISHFSPNVNRHGEAGMLFSPLLSFLTFFEKATLMRSPSLHMDLQEPCLLLGLIFDLAIDAHNWKAVSEVQKEPINKTVPFQDTLVQIYRHTQIYVHKHI